jgi:serine/threonine-protein kinase
MESAGGYRINRRLQPNPTREIYEATGVGGQDRLVIRFLEHARPMLPATKQECRAELSRVSKLHHPHIAGVLSLDAAPDGVPFVVRERLEGQSLKTYLGEQDRMPPRQAVYLVIQVALTLAAAHKVGVFHLNLRPGQVFVYDTEGTLQLGKLLGFGLWRLQGHVMPSPYVAPEQQDDTLPIDGRADQFALAAIAYRLLSGADASARPLPLDVIEGAGPALDVVLQRGLARHPAARFPSILSFAAALQSALPG